MSNSAAEKPAARVPARASETNPDSSSELAAAAALRKLGVSRYPDVDAGLSTTDDGRTYRVHLVRTDRSIEAAFRKVSAPVELDFVRSALPLRKQLRLRDRITAHYAGKAEAGSPYPSTVGPDVATGRVRLVLVGSSSDAARAERVLRTVLRSRYVDVIPTARGMQAT